MEDLLFQSAMTFNKLIGIKYHIVLGRKNKQYELNIRFRKDDYFHLVGLQHLSDIVLPSNNKERIFKDILAGRIRYDTIAKSDHFNEYKIQERIEGINHIETLFDSNRLIFLINRKRYVHFSNINADYLCEYKKEDEKRLYLFLIDRIKTDEVGCCSLFYNNTVDYKVGTAEAKVILLEKIDDNDSVTKIIYKHPKFDG